MTEAVNVITKEIQRHQSKLVELEEQMKQLEIELPQVRSNLEALKRALSIIEGKPIEKEPEEPPKVISSDSTKKNRGLREGSQTFLAHSILKEAKSSLTMNELYSLALKKDQNLDFSVFSSGVYGLARKKRYFRLKSGKISILE